VSTLSFFVAGMPAPQGSKRHVGKGVMVESSKAVKPWRQDVTAAALDAITGLGDAAEFEPFTTAVDVRVTFYFPRPRSHYGTGRNANRLKDTAPDFVPTKPDVDKLLRSTFDALTAAGIWRDDNLAADVRTSKLYGAPTGARITIRTIERPTQP
jgi:crossover junction endodeoxyribonuclease RusA